MKDPTSKSEWALAYCGGCGGETNHWRVRERVFRCTVCGAEREVREADHDRDGLLDR